MKADLHFHTTMSDGTASPATMVKAVKKRGLDGFSITDHDILGDVREYRELARDLGLIYVSGIEITTQKGHLLAYATPDEADILREFKPLQPLQFYVEKAEPTSIILSPAHPFDHLRFGMGKEIFTCTWDAVETFNGSAVFPFSNRRAHAAAKALNLPEIGGSDEHTPYYVGLAYTEADASTAEEVITRIRKGRTSVGGKHLNFLQFSRRMLKSKIFK